MSRDFRKTAAEFGIKHEFIWKNTPEQNGHVESFHGKLKKEYIWPHDFSNYQEAAPVLEKAFVDYNQHRIHSALKYITPAEFVAQWEMKHK